MQNDQPTLIQNFKYHKYSYLQYADPAHTDQIQLDLLKEHLTYSVLNSPYYGKKLQDININEIKNINEINMIPLTEKADIACSTKEFFAVESKHITDICLTSASTGLYPTIIPQTAQDLARLAYNEKFAFEMAEINCSDTILICAALDRCFMAGLAYFLGCLKLNGISVRAGSSNAAHIWELAKLLKATVIIGVPSLIYRVGNYALKNGEDPRNSNVKKLIGIGEPVRDKVLNLFPMGKSLESMWNATIYSTYASTEVATTFCECTARQGGHLRPELSLTEIVDDQGNIVENGKPGEVIVTPLGVTGMPLIRFRTNDISYIIDKPCPCGRTTKRLAPIMGRKNQMLKYKGTTIFPNTIINLLEGDPRFHTGYIEARKNEDGTDHIILFASLQDTSSNDEWMKEKISASIRVVPEIRIISCQQADSKVYQSDKKRKRIIFFDLRT